MSRKKCIVNHCVNRLDEGTFVGDLCAPCHRFITSGEGTFSQAYRNSLFLLRGYVTTLFEILGTGKDLPAISSRESQPEETEMLVTLRNHFANVFKLLGGIPSEPTGAAHKPLRHERLVQISEMFQHPTEVLAALEYFTGVEPEGSEGQRGKET